MNETPADLLAHPGFLQRDPEDGWQFAEPATLGIETGAALAACVDAMCPFHLPEVTHLPGGGDVLKSQVIDQVRRHLVYMHPLPALGLKAAFLLVDWSPLLMFRATRRLRDMAPDEAAEQFAHTEHSRFAPIARLAAGVRAAVVFAFYDLPEVHGLLDYDPVGHMRERTDLRRRLLSGHDATDADMLRPSEAQLLAAAPTVAGDAP